MTQILNAAPGQQCTIVLEVLDGYQRADSLIMPYVSRIVFPSLNMAAGYPQLMNRISTGLYLFNFGIPQGATAVGSYIVDVAWTAPSGQPAQTFYQVVVSAPYGNYSVTTG